MSLDNPQLKTIISPCCKSFNHYVDSELICSRCGKSISTVLNGEEIVIAVHYNTRNTNTDDSNQQFRINKDIVNEQNQKYKRMAKDPTLELVNIPCPYCDEQYGRFFRDAHGVGMCVCKNRHLY
jgi:hypothetical protein